jgi:transposase
MSESERIVQLEKQLAFANLMIQRLEEKLRLQRIEKYGPGSEKLSSAQLELLELEPGVSRPEIQAESQREPLPQPAARTKHRKHPGRQELPAGLPRVERVILCTPEQCACKACGRPTAVIGYEASERLDVEPAQYFVAVTKREKRACKSCGEGGVAVTAVPERIVEKGLVSDRVVIDTVVAKDSDHLPLYRQSAILQREAGVEIDRGTLDGWVMRVGELLGPIVSVMRRELLGAVTFKPTRRPLTCRCTRGAHSANRRLYRLRWRGRAENGACRLLGARTEEVFPSGQTAPRR